MENVTLDIRKAKEGEAAAVVELIEKRIRWMDEKQISQWNKEDYLSIYPPSYFEKLVREGAMFVAVCGKQIAGAAAVLTRDSAWEADRPAFYVHHLVTDTAYPGTGKALLAFIEAYGREQGMDAVRLDAKKGAEALGKFYDGLGYEVVGERREGDYVGERREKVLR